MLACGSVGILLVLGRLRLSEAVADTQQIVQRRFTPLIQQGVPRLQQTQQSLAGLLEATGAAHQARIAQLRAAGLENEQQIARLAAQAEQNLQLADDALAQAANHFPPELRPDWDHGQRLFAEWLATERSLITLSRSLAASLNQRARSRDDTETAFVPFRLSLDLLGQQIDDRLLDASDPQRLAALGQAVSLVLNADRDAYQAIIAERQLATDFDHDPAAYELLRQEFMANVDQIRQRLERAEALLPPHERVDFEQPRQLYQTWRRHAEETVAITDQVLDQLRQRADRIETASERYQQSRLWIARLTEALDREADLQFAAFLAARDQAVATSDQTTQRASSYLALFNALAGVACLALIVLLVFQRRLVRKLLSLSRYLNRLDESRLDLPYQMPPQRFFPSRELGELETNLNNMRLRLVSIIQAHRDSESRLAKSEARYANLFYNAVSPHLLVHPENGQIVDANEAAAVLYQLDQETLRAARLDQLDAPDQIPSLAERIAALPRERSLVCTVQQQRRDGSPFAARAYAGMVEDNGAPHALIVLHDVSERVDFERRLIAAKDEAEAANRAKDDFLSVMSHELRTPLNPIVGYAQLIAQQSDDPTIAEFSRSIQNAADRMLDLIDSILHFTQLTQNEQPAEIETFPIDALMTEARDMAGLPNTPAIRIHNGMTDEGIEPVPPDLVLRGPRRAFVQILLNFLNNAIKYGNGSPIDLLLGFPRSPDSAPQLHLEVRDAGPGVPPDFQDDLFEPFTQADSTFTRSHEGIGLGLAICKRLSERIGGRIGYRPNQPQGAVFWLAAPVAIEADVSTNRRHDANLPDYAQPLRSLASRVLIVEDNEQNAAYLSTALRQLGLRVTHAPSGPEAIKQARQNRFDLALIDISMQGMDGFETLQRLQTVPEFRDRAIPIAVTAHVQDRMRQDCLNRGFRDFLSKPVSPHTLGQTLLRHLAEAG